MILLKFRAVTVLLFSDQTKGAWKDYTAKAGFFFLSQDAFTIG
jgi:hypothetical protein